MKLELISNIQFFRSSDLVYVYLHIRTIFLNLSSQSCTQEANIAQSLAICLVSHPIRKRADELTGGETESDRAKIPASQAASSGAR